MIKRRYSFTLIEFVMVIVILGIIAGAAIPLMLAVTEGWIVASQRNEMASSSRISINRTTREMRRIKDLTSVITANSSTFSFIDIDDNTITIDFSGGQLRRTINGATNILAENLSSLSFTYYDVNNFPIVTPVISPSSTDIRCVQIDLGFSSSGNQLNSRCQVCPRRLQ